MHSKNRLIFELALIGSISIAVSLIFNRSICFFRNFFGIPCPACGMTRAYLYLLQMRFSDAFKAHPLFLAVPFIILRSRFIFYTIAALFIAVWIIRMYLYFPNVEPFVFNENAFYILIIKKLGMI